jgi:hypothetical protein
VGSIKHKKDLTNGWIPSEWSFDYPGHLRYEFKVTSYAINEKIDPALFSQEFPPGTAVQENMNPPSPGTLRHYVVQHDGSKRMISHEEYLRLAGVYQREKEVRVKPQKK